MRYAILFALALSACSSPTEAPPDVAVECTADVIAACTDNHDGTTNWPACEADCAPDIAARCDNWKPGTVPWVYPESGPEPVSGKCGGIEGEGGDAGNLWRVWCCEGKP